MQSPVPQFNIATFGKYVNITFNDCFLQEMTKVLNTDNQIADDFRDFTDALALCFSNENTMTSVKDDQDEFAIWKYNSVYAALVDQEFTKDFAFAIIDSVHLLEINFNKKINICIGPLFAFAKQLESMIEKKQRARKIFCSNRRGIINVKDNFKRGNNVF